MRAVVATAALMLAGVSGTEVQLHKPSVVPKGWRRTVANLDRQRVFDVHVGIKRSNTKQLTEKLLAVSDPRNADYLQHLTWEQAGALFRPAQGSIDAVLGWLRSIGAEHVDLHPHGDRVKAQLTAAQLEAATGGLFERFMDESGRVVDRIANGVRVPASVASVIDTFSGFHGFPLAMQVHRESNVTGLFGSVHPDVIEKVHNIPQITKSGKRNIQAIAQFQGQYVDDNDLAKFCTKYEPQGRACKIAQYIGPNPPKEAGVESMLDTEYIMGLGQGTETWVFSYSNMDFCADLLQFGGDVTANATFPYVVSVSYGSQKIDFCDSNTITRLSEDIQKLGTLGVTVMISSGDDGSGHESRQGTNDGKVAPAFPASIPYVTAVGATYFVSGTSGEQKATTQFGSGGGFSFDYTVPDYQAEAVSTYLKSAPQPKQGLTFAKNGRGTPDVSLLGQSFTVIWDGFPQAVGGTSASSPSFAAIVTLLNEVCLAESGKPLGFANPFFYQNAASFVDVTKGTSAIGENLLTGVWPTSTGWDAATGLGYPDFAKLQVAAKTACAKARKA